MARPRAEILLKLREQMQFLRNSLQTFYSGNFAESVRIATTIRVLVHETGRSKPLLKQATPNGLQLPILDQKSERLSEDEIFSFAVSVRLEPTIAPAVRPWLVALFPVLHRRMVESHCFQLPTVWQAVDSPQKRHNSHPCQQGRRGSR